MLTALGCFAMELTPLRQFRAIALAGHMTKAARAVGVSQPALSAMLKKLEREVGAPLLDRTGRGVELTEAGRAFLAHAEDALRRVDAGVHAVRQIVGLEAGSIRIGGGATAVTYLLPPVVRAVRRAHPGLRFYVRETGSAAVATAVASGELDLGIVTLPVAAGVAGELVATPLVEDELRLIVPGKRVGAEGRGPGGNAGGAKGSKSVPASLSPRASGASKATASSDRPLVVSARAGSGRAAVRGASTLVGASNLSQRFEAFASFALRSEFRWKDLAGVPVVAFEAGTAVRALVDDAAKKAGESLDVVMELRSIESIKSMVAAGIGVGFVSRFALRAEDGFGAGLASKESRLSRTLAIVRRNDRRASAAVGAFERAMKSAMRPG